MNKYPNILKYNENILKNTSCYLDIYNINYFSLCQTADRNFILYLINKDSDIYLYMFIYKEKRGFLHNLDFYLQTAVNCNAYKCLFMFLVNHRHNNDGLLLYNAIKHYNKNCIYLLIANTINLYTITDQQFVNILATCIKANILIPDLYILRKRLRICKTNKHVRFPLNLCTYIGSTCHFVTYTNNRCSISITQFSCCWSCLSHVGNMWDTYLEYLLLTCGNSEIRLPRVILELIYTFADGCFSEGYEIFRANKRPPCGYNNYYSLFHGYNTVQLNIGKINPIYINKKTYADAVSQSHTYIYQTRC